MLRADDPTQLNSLLSIFLHRPFPLGPEPLISLVRGSDEKVANAAWNALAAIEHPTVRALALEFLESPRWRNKAVDLFVENYQLGDHTLISQALQAEQNETFWHWVGMGALSVFEAHRVPECVPILLSLYDTDPCGNCRERAVPLLDRLGALPSWIIEEFQYDESPENREIARDLALRYAGTGGAEA